MAKQEDEELARLLAEARELSERLNTLHREISKRMGEVAGEFVDPFANRKRQAPQKQEPAE